MTTSTKPYWSTSQNWDDGTWNVERWDDHNTCVIEETGLTLVEASDRAAQSNSL